MKIKTIKIFLYLAILIFSFSSYAQTRIGTISAYQVYNNEVLTGDLVLYYPKEPVRIKESLWMTLELQSTKLSTFIELTIENRHKLTSILEAYQKLSSIIETPKKLPGSYSLGTITVRGAFADSSGKYHLAQSQHIIFYVKFDKNGKKTLAMNTGLMTSKNQPGVTHNVPLIWFNKKMVQDYINELSDSNIASFLRNKGKTIDPAALELLINSDK